MGETATAGPVLARFARPRSTARTRLGIVADAHVTPTGSGTWKTLHRSETRLRTAVEALNGAGVDATVVIGDLTKDGAPAEFDLVDEILADLDAPWIAVPGNHDVPKTWDEHTTPSVEAFADRYARGSYPFHLAVGGVDLIGLDSATGEADLRGTHEGVVSEDQLAWLDESLHRVSTPVVLHHHNLIHASRHAGEFADADFYRLGNADALRALLARHEVPLTLSGHIHWPSAAKRDGVRELIAPSTCSFPQAAATVEVGPDGTTVRLVPLAGPKGIAESYVRAASGNAHGQTIAAHADRGYFDSLPSYVEPRLGADTARVETADD